MKRICGLLLLVLCLGMVSCTDDPVVGPSGEIAGFAGLRGTDGERLRDQSGIRVMLRSTNLSTLTDSLGKWRVANVPAGIYDIELSKPGYATNLIRAYQFVGGGTAYITSITDLVRSMRDTMVLRNFSFVPEYEYFYRDTLIETDTGWMRPIDSNALQDRAFRLEGSVSFESDTQTSSPIYLQPYHVDLSLVPSNNYHLGVVRKGSNDLTLSVQLLIQRAYPRGVPVELVFTTRAMNTFYFEPSTRRRIVTDPHDLLRVVVTIPED
jgi:hypothetical protein